MNYYDSICNNTYTNLEGLFDLIKEEKMCISKNSENDMKIWWNQDYLDELMETLPSTSGSKCK